MEERNGNNPINYIQYATATGGNALPSPFPNLGNVDTNATAKALAEAAFKPYNYGSIVEAIVSSNGDVTTKKLWTMGRLSHGKTV